jgi:hypothetical protein
MATTARSRYYVSSVTEARDEVVFCHSYGHAWDPGPVSKLSPVGREVWTVKLHCGSCGKDRTDHVEPGTFELHDRHYTRVEGYTVEDGAGRPEWRAEAIRRVYARQGNRNVRVVDAGDDTQT